MDIFFYIFQLDTLFPVQQKSAPCAAGSRFSSRYSFHHFALIIARSRQILLARLTDLLPTGQIKGVSTL
jgi:hypothetical protein